MSEPSNTQRTFASPRLGWYLLLDGGMVMLITFVASRRAYERTKEVVPLPSRRTVGMILAAATAIHVGEGTYAYKAAKRRGFGESAMCWALQTFVVGFPSLLKMAELANERSNGHPTD